MVLLAEREINEQFLLSLYYHMLQTSQGKITEKVIRVQFYFRIFYRNTNRYNNLSYCKFMEHLLGRYGCQPKIKIVKNINNVES